MGIDFSWSNTACEHLDIISIHKHKYFSTNFNKEYAKFTLHTNVRVNSEWYKLKKNDYKSPTIVCNDEKVLVWVN